jgi:hypothetical protein
MALRELEEYAKEYAVRIGYNGEFSYARDGDRVVLGESFDSEFKKAA